MIPLSSSNSNNNNKPKMVLQLHHHSQHPVQQSPNPALASPSSPEKRRSSKKILFMQFRQRRSVSFSLEANQVHIIEPLFFAKDILWYSQQEHGLRRRDVQHMVQMYRKQEQGVQQEQQQPTSTQPNDKSRKCSPSQGTIESSLPDELVGLVEPRLSRSQKRAIYDEVMREQDIQNYYHISSPRRLARAYINIQSAMGLRE